MKRYNIITEKNPREIVLLRSSGCIWRKCPFCDYYHDSSPNAAANFKLNQAVLNRVSGIYGDLEVINSGSVFELDADTLKAIRTLCRQKNIHTLHFETHYLYRGKIADLRSFFSGIQLKMKLGLETFDYNFRENILQKGIGESDPAVIAQDFEEANFLFGVKGQTYDSMLRDLQLGLKYFERICVNLFCRNTTAVTPDKQAIKDFIERLYPQYRNNDRIDILLNNQDFGVGD